MTGYAARHRVCIAYLFAYIPERDRLHQGEYERSLLRSLLSYGESLSLEHVVLLPHRCASLPCRPKRSSDPTRSRVDHTGGKGDLVEIQNSS